jgi:hypothetical protein
VVTGLDPKSRVLVDQYDSALARLLDTPYSEIEGCIETALSVVPNDRNIVEERFRARGIVR